MKLNKLAMLIACSLAVTGCGKEEGTKLDSSPAVAEPQSAKPSVSSSVQYTESGSVMVANVSVHDPSVVKVDDTYYIFGSHLAAAKSTACYCYSYCSCCPCCPSHFAKEC